MRTRVGVITAVTLSVLAMAGCEKSAVSGSPQPQSGGAATQQDAPKADSPSNADPKSLIASAAKTTRDELSCKFESKMEIKGEGGPGGFGWTSKGEIDFKNNRSKIDSVMDTGGKKTTMTIVNDGTNLYTRTSTEGAPSPRWTKTDLKQLQSSLGELGATGGQGTSSDPMMFIDKIKEIADVTPDGSETIRGVPTTRYKVTVDLAKLPADQKDSAEIPADGSGAIKMFVDSKGRLARFQMSMSGEGAGGLMNWDLFDYGTQVKIDVPAADEVDGN
nr:Putative lipoprotein SCO2725 precursor [Kibdelosporangium sp. MJ126-NF4]